MFLFYHYRFLNKGSFILPLKWFAFSDGNEKIYYEKSIGSNYWIKYVNGIISAQYTEILMANDANGDLIVIYKHNNSDLQIKLMSGYSCSWTIEQSCRKHKVLSGNWLKKQGKFFFFLCSYQIIWSIKKKWIISIYFRFNLFFYCCWCWKEPVVSDDFVLPLTWISNFGKKWYFEKQKESNDWLEYYDQQVIATFKQTTFVENSNGDLVVMIKRQDSVFTIKLTDGYSCYSININECTDNKIFLAGYWLRKKSKYT